VTQCKFGALLLLLLAPECGGTKAAETLARPRPFAESAGNLQQTFAIRGANPRFSRFASSKSASDLQQASSVALGELGPLAGTGFGGAPVRRARDRRDQDQVIEIVRFPIPKQEDNRWAPADR
jgi:hypothetical protein